VLGELRLHLLGEEVLHQRQRLLMIMTSRRMRRREVGKEEERKV
jgi:hypothetical protein